MALLTWLFNHITISKETEEQRSSVTHRITNCTWEKGDSHPDIWPHSQMLTATVLAIPTSPLDLPPTPNHGASTIASQSFSPVISEEICSSKLLYPILPWNKYWKIKWVLTFIKKCSLKKFLLVGGGEFMWENIIHFI